jgi:hypothetical protein
VFSDAKDICNGIIPGSSQTKAEGISSPGMYEAILIWPCNDGGRRWNMMEYYVELDLSLKQTSICVVNETGLVVREGVVASDPETISVFVRSKAPDAVRIGHRDRTDVHVVMDRAQATWPAGDLHRRAPCQGGAQDADQQKRSQ